jgi:hypothetical protein
LAVALGGIERLSRVFWRWEIGVNWWLFWGCFEGKIGMDMGDLTWDIIGAHLRLFSGVEGEKQPELSLLQ